MSSSPQSCIKSIKLCNFRNYTKAELDSQGSPVVLLGENGSGKTNVLEAISLLSKGSGLRNIGADCMQNHKSETPWGVHHTVLSNGTQFSVSITKHESKRRLSIDKKASCYSALHDILCIVWLIPQLDHILLKAPSERLRFFDRVVHIFDKDYSSHMIKYEKAKRDRKKVLHEAPQNLNWLTSLESVMASSGVHIAQTRLNVLKILQRTASDNDIDSPFLKFAIHLDSRVFELLDDQERAVDRYLQHMEESRAKDASGQLTSFGIHNDQFQMSDVNKNIMASSCSTGEQKILLLSLLLTAAISKRRIHNQAPIMLLDDIMSHLDNVHKEELIRTIKDVGCQTWITDVDGKNFAGLEKHFKCFHIANNSINPM
ncbi:DNA replication/repair protein RecF [Anaplasma capra]|uniref:DNA replication/repair protein RecF n=1 Tax=Anaplasma capra TaxID=1562740 RepID=UPI0021D5BC59|nr:DNA replication/repair protein RecF [Anaplasma capra]MCU7611138.1 DNA replication/repair protein RecF [Anaplasma capra]MCU7612358.1 DNA replication/repair protein RecF [Anaplasma capra]